MGESCSQTLQPMRSKLFVPGSRPELFNKAMASEADGISIDLEDAVTEAHKASARQTVSDWLGTRQREVDGKTVIVRINAMDTPHFAADLAAVVCQGVDVVNLPKPASAQAVREAAALITQWETTHGLTYRVGLLLNIETPWALHHAAELAAADPRVMGLQVGLGDLFEPLGIDRRDTAAVHQVLFAVRMAAGEAGVQAWDGAFANVRDAEGYTAEAHMARRLGFAGKTCIHPSQVALANQVFRPTEAEMAHAQQVLAARDQAHAQGLGAYMVDGRMVDAPFEHRAEAVVVTARRMGLLSSA